MFLSEQNIFHTGCIDMVSPYCVLSGVLIDFLSKPNYIDMVSPQNAFFGDLQDQNWGWNICHISYIYMVSSQYVFAYVLPASILGNSIFHTDYIAMASHQYAFFGAL